MRPGANAGINLSDDRTRAYADRGFNEARRERRDQPPSSRSVRRLTRRFNEARRERRDQLGNQPRDTALGSASMRPGANAGINRSPSQVLTIHIPRLQ